RRLNESDEDDSELRDALEALSGFVVCPDCGGARLNREARSIRLAGKGLHEVTALSVAEAMHWFENSPREDGAASAAGAPSGDSPWARARAVLLTEIQPRLSLLDAVGLGYLTLDRPPPTLPRAH